MLRAPTAAWLLSFLALAGATGAPSASAAHCEPGGGILPWPGWVLTGHLSPLEMHVYRIRTTLPVASSSSEGGVAVDVDHPVLLTFASSGDAGAYVMKVVNEADCHISSQSLLPVVGGCVLPDDLPVCWSAAIVLDGKTTWIEVWGDVRAPLTSADYAMVVTGPQHHDLSANDP